MRNLGHGPFGHISGGRVNRFVPIIGFLGAMAAVRAPAHAQLSLGFSPAASGTSTDASGWRTSAQLSSTARLDAPLGELSFDDVFERGAGGTHLSAASLGGQAMSPSLGGFRLVASSSVDRDRTAPGIADRRVASAALSYRYADAGGWVGYNVERFARPSLVTGLWRQLGSSALVSLTSTCGADLSVSPRCS